MNSGSASKSTLQQLEAVLLSIQTSRRCLILVVDSLLADLRPTSQSRRSPATKSQTLATLAEVEGRKRKRSITHFDGIPMSIVRTSSPRAPADRRVVSSRRMRELDRIMGRLGCRDAPESEMGGDEEDESDSDEDDDLIIIM